jgi:periplasmic protein TonB
MKFHSDDDDRLDKDRLRRMATGWVAGAAAIVVTVIVLALNPAQAFEEIPEDKVIDVALAKAAEAPKVEPKIVVQPTRTPVIRRAAAPSAGGGGALTPNKIPDGPLEEADPSKDVNPYGDAFDLGAYGNGSGGGPRVASVINAKVVEKKPVFLQPVAPKQVAVATTPAVEVNRGIMSYPAAAKAAKVQGTVSVKFVVGPSGMPEQIRAISGPDPLRAACEERVRGTRYQPATDRTTGQPVQVTKILRCVFRLT